MGGLRAGLQVFLSRCLRLWVKPEVAAGDVVAQLRDACAEENARIVYVLESGGLADVLTLEGVCRAEGLPSPQQDLSLHGSDLGRSLIILRRLKGWFLRRRSRKQSVRLTRLLECAVDARDAGDGDTAGPVYLVPVGIYWGRAPGKERSWLSLAFSDDWAVAGRTRKFITTLLHGRQTLMQFSQPTSLSRLMDEGLDGERTMRKTSRVLRVHFRRRREATVGPDLSHRRTLINEILLDPAVRRAIDASAERGSRAHDKAQKKARKYALEIAADLSYSTVRVLERLLTWLWQRIYDGVAVHGIDQLQRDAEGSEIIYVPCHRSHFDYLLLSYVLYKNGLSLPYVAAGINLNLPVAGSILRRGGAFFLRRSFSGNRLYSAVFRAYVRALQTRGYPLEYFIEGGRSRTGRLLAPKGGMLSMSIQAYLEDSRRPVRFVPVYFGYERLIEGTSFISELRGDEKKKESLLGLFRSLKALREQFGQVYVNFGESIDLDTLLDEVAPDWRTSEQGETDSKPAWLAPAVDTLGWRILERINSAAAVTPISLLALALLGTPRQTMALADLRRQLALYQSLYERTPYSEFATLPELDADGIIAHGLNLGVIQIEPHPMGDIVSLPEGQALLLTYFRNNILHLTAVHSLVAACFIHGQMISTETLQRLLRLSAPFVRRELRLRWQADDLPRVVGIVIDALVDSGLLERDGDQLSRPTAGSARAFALTQLGQSVVPVLQRYYMTIALLDKHGSGQLTQNKLEEICQLCAQRLSILYGSRSPDFFDRHLFRDFVSTLRARGVLDVDDERHLTFNIDFEAIEADARLVLGEPLRHSILTITHDDDPDDDDDDDDEDNTA
ncbi:MAG: glycerol-3-phosphate 1-O-acyltransferase PlsB [Pseudomonadota bacterium]